MFEFLGRTFSSVVLAITMLFGGHAVPAVEPAAIPSTTEAIATSTEHTQSEASQPEIKASLKASTPTSQPSTQVAMPVTTSTSASTTLTTSNQASMEIRVDVTANPSSIEFGGSATIKWNAEGATSCTMNSSPALLAPSGLEATGVLTTSATYTLRCGDGSRTGSSTVKVNVAAKVLSSYEQLLLNAQKACKNEPEKSRTPCYSGTFKTDDGKSQTVYWYGKDAICSSEYSNGQGLGCGG